MRRCYGVALVAAVLYGGCSSPHAAPVAAPIVPADSVVLEIEGKAFQAGCANGSSGGGFGQGATCGSAAGGAGPLFHSLECDPSLQQAPPIYFVGAFFRDLGAAPDAVGDLTFDLADPTHEDHVTVMMNYMDETRTEYHYCTAPPRGDMGGASYPASSGTVTLHRFTPEPEAPAGVAMSDVELTNVVVPSFEEGPQITIVAAHLYFQ